MIRIKFLLRSCCEVKIIQFFLGSGAVKNGEGSEYVR